jgi:hypothetical protein
MRALTAPAGSAIKVDAARAAKETVIAALTTLRSFALETIAAREQPLSKLLNHYQRVARILAWIGIAAIVALSAVPAQDRPVFYLGQPFRLWGRPFVEHGSAFALVATAFAVGYRWSVGQLVLLAFLFCGAVELLQIPLPTRHARVSDLLIDFVAACFAIVLVKAFRPASGMVTR